VAHQRQEGGHQHQHHGRRQQHRDGQADAELLDRRVAVEDEAAEDADHDEPSRRDDRPGVLHAPRDGVPVVVAHLAAHRDGRQQEHLVVHRQAEQHGEHHQRDVARDRHGVARGLDAQQVDAPPPLERRRQHAEGGADAQQVDDGRLQRHQQRAEGDHQHEEAQGEDDGDHQQQP
jgi:hypothetical protein